MLKHKNLVESLIDKINDKLQELAIEIEETFIHKFGLEFYIHHNLKLALTIIPDDVNISYLVVDYKYHKSMAFQDLDESINHILLLNKKRKFKPVD